MKSLKPNNTNNESREEHSRYTINKNRYKSILIKNAPFIFSCKKNDKLSCLKNHSIVIESGIIKDILPAKKIVSKKFDLIYNAGKRGGIVITPGLFNTHTHLPMYLMRSAMMLDSNETIDQTIAAMPIWERAMTDDDYMLAAVGDITEQQKHGVTTTLNHFAVFNPVDKAAKLTKHNIINAISTASNTHPENNPDLISKLYKNKKTHTSELAIAVHYLYKAKPSVLKAISELVNKYNLLFTCHLAESKLVAENCVKTHGTREIETLKKYNLLNSNTILSHALYINDKEIKDIADAKVGIAHLPTSNTIHKSGTFPIWKFFEAGAKPLITLGTDSVVSKSRMDVLTEAYQARMTHIYKKRLKFGTLFKMMTINGARILKQENRGKILPGMKADLAFWKLKDRDFIPFDKSNPFTLLGNIITHNGSTVRDLMINGKMIIKNRKHKFVDESKLLELLQQKHMKMRRKIERKK